MKDKQEYGFVNSDYEFFIEPDGGINNGKEFVEELQNWAAGEKKQLVVEVEGMEPEIIIDGKSYLCKLGDPYSAATATNPIAKAMKLQGVNRIIGPELGYKWIYVYAK